MKLTFFLLTVALCNVYADGLSQTVTFSGVNVPFNTVLDEVEKQTGYVFFYDETLLLLAKPVTITSKNDDIHRFLSKVFNDQPLVFKITNRNIILSERPRTKMNIDDLFPEFLIPLIDIHGRVADEKGEVVAGASVMVKGTNKGTTSNTTGDFQLAGVQENVTLVVTGANIEKQEINITNQAEIEIVVKSAVNPLGEIVVVGYGDVKRRAVTGAVSSANLTAFRESPNVSLLGSLRGSVPGLNVGSSTSAGRDPQFSIRGINSISGSLAPLIVLDGIIYRGTVNEINPNDIQSVDILKDASSAAIYGSQAANGVILITSKKGKISDKPTITYTAKYAIREAANVPEYYSPQEYLQLYRDWDWMNSRLGPDYTTPNPDNDITQYMFAPERENYAANRSTDWWKLITRKGHLYESDLSVSGASEKTSYYISGSVSEQKDIIINDNYRRVTGRVNLESKVTNWLKIGTYSFLSNNDYSGAEPDVFLGYHMPPYAYPYNADGSLATNPSGYYFDNPLNPVRVDDFNKNLQINTTNYAVVKLPLKGLSYEAKYANQFAQNRAYFFDPNFGNFTGKAQKKNMFFHDWTFDNIVRYDRQIKEHNFGITLVYGQERRSAEGTTSRGEGFTNTILGYNSIESANKQFTESESWKEASLYQVGRLSYSYDDRYYAVFTIRRDGFSGFGENKKFGMFPSLSVGYVISETQLFQQSVPWISYMKVRGSFGSAGNRTVGRYQTLAAVTSRPAYVFGDGGMILNSQFISTLSNPNLGWETTTGANLGIDFELINGRFSGNIEYFNTDTRDLLYNIMIPSISGFNNVATNIGKVHNSGVELQVTSTNITSDQFVWRTTLTFSSVKNKVVSILGLDLNNDGREDDLVSSLLFIGKPLGTIYDHRIVGMYQIGDQIPSGYKPGYYRLADRNKDNIIDPNDREFLGNRDPAYRLGILNEIEFKGFTLRVFVNAVQGGRHGYYAENQPNQDGDNITPPTKNAPKEWNYWTPENPNAEYPALNYLPPIGGNVYRQRNFVRLQDLTVSYKVTAPFIRKMKIKDLKIFVNGQNLHKWTKWKGWDPEMGSGMHETFDTDKVDMKGRPLIRSYTMGLNVSI